MADTQNIEVASYQNLAFEGAWKSRSRAIWGIAFLGLITGAAVGLLAPFFPAMVGAVLWGEAAAHILPSMAIFAATGMATGLGTGILTGSAAGASAAVAKELETRDLQRTQALEQSMGVSIPKPQVQTEPEKTADVRYFNPKISALFAVFGALAGKVMAAGFLAMHADEVVTAAMASNAAIPALTVILGTAVANPLAVTACFIGVMTCFGAIFGVNFPKIGTELQEFAGKLLSGELLGTSWEKENGRAPELSIEPKMQFAQIPSPMPAIEVETSTTNYAAKFKSHGNNTISYRELVGQQSEGIVPHRA